MLPCSDQLPGSGNINNIKKFFWGGGMVTKNSNRFKAPYPCFLVTDRPIHWRPEKGHLQTLHMPRGVDSTNRQDEMVVCTTFVFFIPNVCGGWLRGYRVRYITKKKETRENRERRYRE